MSYVVAIPSHNRTDVIQTKTLPLLKRCGIPASKIHIFVSGAEQLAKYKADVPKELYGKVVSVGGHGIGEAKNGITAYFPAGKMIVYVEDDINDFVHLSGGKLVSVSKLEPLINEGFKLCKEHKTILWGINAVANAFYMGGKAVTTDLKFIIGTLYGLINDKSIKLKTNVKEDYELSFIVWTKYKAIIRFNHYSQIRKGYPDKNKGGLADIKERKARTDVSVDYLLKTYPSLVTENKKRKTGLRELTLKRGKQTLEGGALQDTMPKYLNAPETLSDDEWNEVAEYLVSRVIDYDMYSTDDLGAIMEDYKKFLKTIARIKYNATPRKQNEFVWYNLDKVAENYPHIKDYYRKPDVEELGEESGGEYEMESISSDLTIPLRAEDSASEYEMDSEGTRSLPESDMEGMGLRGGAVQYSPEAIERMNYILGKFNAGEMPTHAEQMELITYGMVGGLAYIGEFITENPVTTVGLGIVTAGVFMYLLNRFEAHNDAQLQQLMNQAQQQAQALINAREDEDVRLQDTEGQTAAAAGHSKHFGGSHRTDFLKANKLEDKSYSLKELSKISAVPMKTLKEVYKRGIGAYKTQPSSVRLKGSFVKGVKAPMSKKLSKEQWAMARVYSFLDGNPKHDNDLRGGVISRTEAEKPPKVVLSDAERADTSIKSMGIRNKSAYNNARDELLTLLREHTVKKISKPSMTSSTNRGNVIGTIGRTETFGFGDTRRGFAPYATNDKKPELFKALVKFGNTVVPKGFDYQGITLNHGVKAKKHKDAKNVGPSIIIGIGDFTGGKIRVWDGADKNPRDFDLHDKPVMFNGGLLYHETQPFNGERYTFIFYKQNRRPRSGKIDGQTLRGSAKSMNHGAIYA